MNEWDKVSKESQKTKNNDESHQVNVGDKVSKESQGNRQSPDDEPLVTPVVEINHLITNDGTFW